MSDIRRTVRCARCNQDFGFNEVKFLSDGKRMACLSCLGVVQKEEAAQREREGMVLDYQCLDCRYMFRRSATNPPKVCPECGKKDFVRFDRNRLNTNKLLKMADDPRLEKMNRVKPGNFN